MGYCGGDNAAGRCCLELHGLCDTECLPWGSHHSKVSCMGCVILNAFPGASHHSKVSCMGCVILNAFPGVLTIVR